MRKQLMSFGAAFSGIWNAVRSEGHLRFHLVAAVYVIVFSFFYDLSKSQWAVLLFLIGSIIAAELFNTAIENVCDLVTKKRNSHIKTAKDVSAAAVLILSAVAVAIAFVFYFDIVRIQYIAAFFISRPWLLILFVLSLIISVVFIGGFKFKKK
ncbi:MAG: diacylglycerol kinase family protein [Ruminococcus sp.]|nr:diacylglycerol kinase family protein [Ruminococcus sp.]